MVPMIILIGLNLEMRFFDPIRRAALRLQRETIPRCTSSIMFALWTVINLVPATVQSQLLVKSLIVLDTV